VIYPQERSAPETGSPCHRESFDRDHPPTQLSDVESRFHRLL